MNLPTVLTSSFVTIPARIIQYHFQYSGEIIVVIQMERSTIRQGIENVSSSLTNAVDSSK